MTEATGYKLVRLRNGAHSVHSLAYGETMHPGLGPVAEAEALYVRQLKLCERLQNHTGEFVIWDIGLGAAANALTVLRATRDPALPDSYHQLRRHRRAARLRPRKRRFARLFQRLRRTDGQQLPKNREVKFTDGARQSDTGNFTLAIFRRCSKVGV